MRLAYMFTEGFSLVEMTNVLHLDKVCLEQKKGYNAFMPTCKIKLYQTF